MSYHDDFTRLSRSMLVDFDESPEMFYHWYVRQDMPRPRLGGWPVQLGTLCHAVLLEGKPLDELAIEYDQACYKKNGVLNPKPAAIFRDMHEGRECLHSHQFVLAEEIVDAVLESDYKDIIDNGQCEKVLEWTDVNTQLGCRCRPDVYLEQDDLVECYDFKFGEEIGPKKWAQGAKRMKYWLQQVHYSRGLEALYGKRVAFKFVAVETKVPYRIATYEYDPISLDIGRTAYEQILTQVKQCHETGDWRDPWVKEENYLELSPWEVQTAEVELGGFDE
jgi:exodeoxyribonuclease VIII